MRGLNSVTTLSLLASVALSSMGLNVYLLSKRWADEKRNDLGSLSREKSQLSEVPLTGKTLPSFNLVDINGIEVKSEELSTKALLLFFISNIHCEPCIEAAGIIQSFYNEFKQQGLMVIGVSHSPYTAEVRRFARKFDLRYPIVMDPTLEFRERLGLPPTLMSIVLINAKGSIVGVWTTLRSESSESTVLRQQIDSLLGSFTIYENPTLNSKVQKSTMERR